MRQYFDRPFTAPPEIRIGLRTSIVLGLGPYAPDSRLEYILCDALFANRPISIVYPIHNSILFTLDGSASKLLA